MKSVLMFIGLILLIAGIGVLGYQGVFRYTTREKVAQIGDLQVTAQTEKTVYLPPLLGGIALVSGLALIIISRRGK